MGVGDAWTAHKSTDLLTFCVLVLKNGFTVTGRAPVQARKTLMLKLAVRWPVKSLKKIWPLEGYLLKQKLSEQI